MRSANADKACEGEHPDHSGPMFVDGREYVRHEPVHGLEIQGPILGDISQRVPPPLLVEYCVLVHPHIAHFPVAHVVGEGHLPAGLGGITHGRLIVLGVGNIASSEKASVDAVDGGAEGGVGGLPVCEGLDLQGEGEEVQGFGLGYGGG